MDYDFRNRTGSMNRPAPGSSLYPRIAPQPGHHLPVPASRPPQANPAVAPLPSELGIRVMLKPEYQISPPPELSPQEPEVPRSHFNFDFDFERRILAEAEKDVQNWTQIASENRSHKFPLSSTSSSGPSGDPVVEKYVRLGLGREPVLLAVTHYGDDPIKVREFVKGYNLLREMGFSSKNVAEALVMYENDTDKAVTHFLNSSS